MTIASAFNEIAQAQGGTPSSSGTIAGAIDALNDALAGSDQEAASTIEGAVRLLGAHIGGGVAPSGTIEITENGEGIDVAQYAYADVNVSGGSGDFSTATVSVANNASDNVYAYGAFVASDDSIVRQISCEASGSETLTVILYKGYAGIVIESTGGDISCSVTGSLEEDEGSVDVTGDGTITVADA